MFDEKQDKQEFTGSSEARRIVMLEGIATFVECPFTGVGAGQFKNYNPAGPQGAVARDAQRVDSGRRRNRRAWACSRSVS